MALSQSQFNEKLDQLTQFISSHPDEVASSRLSLDVDKATLQNTHFQALLETLNKTALQKLDLAFPVDELNASAIEIAALLNQYVSDRVNYPVIICEQSSPIKPYKNKAFNAFNAKVITHVQQHNQTMRFGTVAHQPASIDEQSIKQNHVVSANTFDKKIKLKALIKHASTRLKNLDQYIKLEVQHTEVEQQEQVQEEIIDVVVQEQEQEQGLFDGQLVDLALFHNEPYRSRISSDTLFNAFKYELFGNMPKAIKFLSHEAAMKMAENAGAFVTLNADNLPQNFMLKRTHQGEMVLDYDPDADEQKTNVFTPKEIRHYDAAELIYDHVDLPESIKTIAAKYSIDTSSKQLDNLWVRYGDAGVQLLFDTLGEPGELSTFMIKQYLNRFPHWDRLLDDHRFMDSLEKIKQYEQAELTCLTEFLSLSDDTTQFNLEDILKGFDAFWFEWSVLANKNKLDLNEINGRWSHKKVGNPLVYMERLLTILRNSRDLPEQLTCLDGLDLDNYGAYYASKYEGFHLVSKEMGLHYDPDKQNAVIFNPDASVYRTELERLVEYCAAEAESLYDRQRTLTREQALVIKDKLFLAPTDDISTIKSKSKLTQGELFKQIEAQHGKIIPYNGQTVEPPYKLYKYIESQPFYSYYFPHRAIREPLPRDEILREKITDEHMLEKAYRFIGQQPKGISSRLSH